MDKAEIIEAHGMANRIATLGVTRHDLTPARASAAFSMMTSPTSRQQLTRAAGWSHDEAESWLTASLTQLLLEPPTH